MKSNEIVAIRNRLGVSRRELASLIGTTYETLCRWENGQREPSGSNERRLREIAGGVGRPNDAEHWILLQRNVCSVLSTIRASEGLVLGTVHALLDPDHRYFVAAIYLKHNTRSILELHDFISLEHSGSRARRLPLVGCFVAGGNKICPTDHIKMFMQKGRTIGADHCILCDRASEEISVWKLTARTSLVPDVADVQRLPHVIVAGT